MGLTEAEIAELQHATLRHFMAGFNGRTFPLRDCWPGPPGKAYIYEMVRRQFGAAGCEYLKGLPIFTSH